MRQNDSKLEYARLRAILREAAVAPTLPPRFQEGVWRRIENAEAGPITATPGWLETLVCWVSRPKFAGAAVAMLLVAGVVLGIQQGAQTARQDAQARYLAAVAPNLIR